MGGTIDGNKLVLSPSNTYRPFPWDAFVNQQEVFEGQIQTEYVAFTFEGDLGSGTYLTPELLVDECDCNGNVDLGCGCGEAGPSGCDNTCGSTLAFDDCGVCNGGNADKDCNGDCFGTAELDSCDVCSGGDSGHSP